MDKSQEASILSARLLEAWDKRVKVADEWNHKIESGQINPGIFVRFFWVLQSLFAFAHYSERRASLEQTWRQRRKRASLVWALNDVFGTIFWTGGLFKVFKMVS